MASRKMTFTIPEELACEFIGRVPARDRSKYVVEALSLKLAERKRRLVQACEAANLDSEVAQIEDEFSALPDEVAEPW